MKKDIKLFWKLYEEYFTNEDLLKNFKNLIDIYHPQKKGKIIDIGCGQSQYLIDFYKNSEHELYAVDEELIQIDALKKRFENIASNSDTTFANKRFNSKDFPNELFSAVIISNVLHFMDFNDAKEFINDVEKVIKTGTLLLLTNHSWKHSSNGDYSYFKHYYKKQDYYKLLPKSKYEYLCFEQKSATKSVKEISFIKKWLELVANENKIFDKSEISKFQSDYFKKPIDTENMTIVVRKK